MGHGRGREPLGVSVARLGSKGDEVPGPRVRLTLPQVS